MTLLRLMESRHRKHINKQRSSEPSQLQQASKQLQLSSSLCDPTSIFPATTTTASLLKHDDGDNGHTMTPEINIVFSLGAYGSTSEFVIPADSQHVSLRCGKLSLSNNDINIEYPELDTPVADTI